MNADLSALIARLEAAFDWAKAAERTGSHGYARNAADQIEAALRLLPRKPTLRAKQGGGGMSDFHTRLSSMLSKEAAEATYAPDRAERMGDMIEGLARGLGFTVAIAANGNAETIDTMIAGAERYALEAAADKAPFAEFMAAARRPA